eukprot:TRINITY_DN12222_c0_g1_i1.p1 TRINITY_DN12222_c0_g1~~TRINITY_DN12222_c0_g1_i1.p1  ORF type:complete len:291 (-),score=36.44 TRINITY_DN12222_c0_g1_i1:86-958(-)
MSGALQQFRSILEMEPDLPVAMAGVRTLTMVLKKSTASTLMGIQHDLSEAASELCKSMPQVLSLKSSCELYLRYVTRTICDSGIELEKSKEVLVQRGSDFVQKARLSRHNIARRALSLIPDHCTVLIHGFSRMVCHTIQQAAQSRRLSVLCTTSNPGNQGQKTFDELKNAGVDIRMIPDASIGVHMETVDLVMFGAEALVENGGIVNRVGTYPIAVLAHSLSKPVYVMAESFKFARIFPLNQRDLCQIMKEDGDNPLYDFTPPHLLSMLVTDLAILTPSAVSDELIKLHA